MKTLQKTKLRGRRGQLGLNEVPSALVTLLVLALVIAVSAIVLTDFRDTQVTNTAGCNSTVTSSCGQAFNSTTDGLTGVDNVANQLGTVGTIVIAAVLLGLIVTAFVFFRNR